MFFAQAWLSTWPFSFIEAKRQIGNFPLVQSRKQLLETIQNAKQKEKNWERLMIGLSFLVNWKLRLTADWEMRLVVWLLRVAKQIDLSTFLQSWVCCWYLISKLSITETCVLTNLRKIFLAKLSTYFLPKVSKNCHFNLKLSNFHTCLQLQPKTEIRQKLRSISWVQNTSKIS